jgi:hypothetical protein
MEGSAAVSFELSSAVVRCCMRHVVISELHRQTGQDRYGVKMTTQDSSEVTFGNLQLLPLRAWLLYRCVCHGSLRKASAQTTRAGTSTAYHS